MQLTLTLTGVSALIVQSPRMMDPFDELAIEIQKLMGKRAKDRTEEELRTIWRLQFSGSLFFKKTVGPFIPGANVLASLRDGAKKARKGKKLLSALLIDQMEIPIQYPGPRTIDDLWADPSFRLIKPVKNAGMGAGNVLRCRPIFHQWSLEVPAELDTREMDLSELEEVAASAGRFAGLGSWRPSTPKGGQYGRYEARVDRL